MKNCHVINHPVLQHHLTGLRDQKTSSAEFRRTMAEMSKLIAYEATKDLTVKSISVQTPLENMTQAPAIADDLIVVSLMRAGNGMLDAVMETLPFAQVGHIGIYRDKFINNTVEYFFRLPNKVEKKKVLLLDPLLATGDTAVAALERLKEYGVGEIRMLCLLASQPGLQQIQEFHPDVSIYCVSIERALDQKGFLLPGIGDAGNRLYGTA